MMDPKGSLCGDVEGVALRNLPDRRVPNSCLNRQIDAVSWAAGLFHRPKSSLWGHLKASFEILGLPNYSGAGGMGAH